MTQEYYIANTAGIKIYRDGRKYKTVENLRYEIPICCDTGREIPAPIEPRAEVTYDGQPEGEIAEAWWWFSDEGEMDTAIESGELARLCAGILVTDGDENDNE